MGEVKETKTNNTTGTPEEEIPGVITTTTNAISDFLKKTKAQDLINWGRKNSLWFMTQPMGCCGVEMIATGCAHYDTDRFGIIPRNSPRHAVIGRAHV